MRSPLAVHGTPLLKLRAAAADGRAVVRTAASAPRIRARIERHAPDVVVEWRFDQLERAGLEALEAVRLALDPGFDVAALRALVVSGCAPALAVRILR